MGEPQVVSPLANDAVSRRILPPARLELRVLPATAAAALVASGAPVLGTVEYGAAARLDGVVPRLEIPLSPLADNPVEVWLGAAPVVTATDGRWRVAESGGVLFAAAIGHETDEQDLEGTTAQLYDEFLALCVERGYPHLWRIWNCLPRINEPERELERYKRFCRARADAFANVHGRGFERHLCASTAVGSYTGRALVVHLVAGRQPGIHHENPRQVSAYRYPREYGPRSPSFARATTVGAAGETLFVSGTASIVGHATVHPGDPATQLEETLRNLRALLSSDGEPATLASLKTYLRHPEHLALVAERLAAEFPGVALTYVQADICRGDLLLEIEAVATHGAS